jgi:hypothetical protein
MPCSGTAAATTTGHPKESVARCSPWQNPSPGVTWIVAAFRRIRQRRPRGAGQDGTVDDVRQDFELGHELVGADTPIDTPL